MASRSASEPSDVDSAGRDAQLYVGLNLPTAPGAHHGEGFDETLAIRMVPEDRLAPESEPARESFRSS